MFTELINGSYNRKIDISTLAKGIYFIVILTESERIIKKIVLE